MFIIGQNDKGLRVTTMQAVETVEQLYYWILLKRRDQIRFLYEEEANWAIEQANILVDQTLQEFLFHDEFRYLWIDIYRINQNTVPAFPGVRTSEKIKPPQLLELFRAAGLDLNVINDRFTVPSGIFQPEHTRS